MNEFEHVFSDDHQMPLEGMGLVLGLGVLPCLMSGGRNGEGGGTMSHFWGVGDSTMSHVKGVQGLGWERTCTVSSNAS